MADIWHKKLVMIWWIFLNEVQYQHVTDHGCPQATAREGICPPPGRLKKRNSYGGMQVPHLSAN